MALLVLGCGANVTEAVSTEELPEREIVEEERPVVSEVIDTVDWRGQEILFSALHGEEGDVLILVDQQLPEQGIDLFQALRLGSQWIVTPAELWIHATGRTDVPELLALDHLSMVAQYDRPSEYQLTREGAPEAENEVQKATSSSAFISAAYPQAATTCWFALAEAQTIVNPPSSFHVCAFLGGTESFGPLRNGDWLSASACLGTPYRVEGSWRLAVVVDTTGPANKPKVQKGISVSATGPLTGSVVTNISNGITFISDLNVPVTNKARFSLGVANPGDTATQTYRYRMARAQLRTGLPGPDGIRCN